MKATRFIVEAIRSEGIDHIFMVPGGLIDSFYPDLCQTNGITPIVAAHEGGAAYMADGYARASGRFGACFTIGGPGATNTITALATAMTDCSPFLLITGEVPTSWEGLGGFQDASPDGIDDISILKTVTRLSLSVEDPLILQQHLRQAISVMLGSNRGPVHLSLPVNVQNAEIKKPYAPMSSALERFQSLDSTCMENLWKCLQGAGYKIVVLAGAGVEASGAAPALLHIAEQYQIPVATTLRAKGVFPEDHPLSLGVFGYAGTRHAAEAILKEDIDVLIVLGSGLNQRDTLFWDAKIRSCKTLVQVDKNPERVFSPFAVDVPIIGDCGAFLKSVAEHGGETLKTLADSTGKRKQWMAQIKHGPRLYDAENMNSAAVPIHPARVLHDLRIAMPKNTVLLVDSGAHRAFAGQYWEAYEPRHYISATNLGPMGWAIPAAIGAKAARPELPCVVITGDGCMQMHGIEVQTAARFQLPVIYVVINNGALGNVYLRARQMGPGPAHLTEIPQHDWAGFAKSLGAEGFRVEKPEDLMKTFKQALALNKTCVIDVRCGRDYATPVEPWKEAQKQWHE